MEKIATDTFSFERIRQNGFVYVDKTAILKTLADGSLGSQFFVSRPRRFGKSLAISTLQCLFEGRRDLFKGLAIEPEWDWSKTYPVLKLDMGSCQGDTVEDIEARLGVLFQKESARLGVPLRAGSVSAQFDLLIYDLAQKNGVVPEDAEGEAGVGDAAAGMHIGRVQVYELSRNQKVAEPGIAAVCMKYRRYVQTDMAG